MINYNKQHISNSDIINVIKALKSSNLTQGKYTEDFELKLQSYFRSKYAVSVSSGTSALILALRAIGLKKNEKVIVPSISFLATANAVEICGGHTLFADINEEDNTLDINYVESLIKKNHNKIKAIIGVDYAGHPCNWIELKKISNKYGIKLINDNCHAMGSKLNGNQGYACKYADLVCQSYHAIKNFTTGEGGSVLTNNYKYFTKIKTLRSHGITKREEFSKSMNKEFWKYSMTSLGYNFRLTDIQSALGISQLRSLNKFVKKRRIIADFYNKSLKSISCFRIPFSNPNIFHSYHLYPLKIYFNKCEVSKTKFMNKLYNEGIKLQVNYIPIHTQKYYKKKYGENRTLKVSENFYKSEVSLPIYYDLSINDCKKIVFKLLQITNDR